jgi:hypothetical protein
MEGLGFIQCPFDKTVFIKWFIQCPFDKQTRFLLFWQHVDDRWGGSQCDEDLDWFLKALEAQLQSAQEATTDVLGLVRRVPPWTRCDEAARTDEDHGIHGARAFDGIFCDASDTTRHAHDTSDRQGNAEE